MKEKKNVFSYQNKLMTVTDATVQNLTKQERLGNKTQKRL